MKCLARRHVRGLKQMISHEFVAVEGQVVLEEDPCDTIQRRRMHKPQDHPAYCFLDAISFERIPARSSRGEAICADP